MKLPEPVDDFQSVYFITDWWDGPKSGFVDFNCKIHCFERIFDNEKDDWSNLYLIRPVSTEEYSLQIESYKLFLDWVNDKSSTRPHPSLDIVNKRYHEVGQLLVGFEHRKIYDFNYKVKWTRND